ncbi:MAG: hypothetical protein ACRDRK_05160 [Pseudonocardia sp.]
MAMHVHQTFRVPAALDLAAIDPRGRPIGPTDKAAAAEEMAELRTRLEDLQEALYAEATGVASHPPGRAVLLVLQAAYTDALRHCDSDAAPWCIIPSDRRWYRNWAIAALLAETLTAMDPQFPPAHFDVDAERARIRASVLG